MQVSLEWATPLELNQHRPLAGVPVERGPSLGDALLELRGDTASARSVCQCPMDVLVRTPAGWRIAERVERGCWSTTSRRGSASRTEPGLGRSVTRRCEGG